MSNIKKILVIDDDPGILEALRAILEMAGYVVDTAYEADKLEGMGQENLPDLILLDMLLSGKDGRLIAKKIKNTPHTKKIPIIMLSAYPDAKEKIGAYGIDDFIAKPFNMDQLLILIQKYA